MSDGPGGKTVGSVNIRVVPDTSNFKREMARLIAWFNGKKLKIGIDVDATQAKAAVEEVTRDRRMTLKVHADTGAARASIKRMEQQRGTIRLGVDLDSARAAAARSKAARSIDVQLDPKIETDQIESAFRFVERDLKVHIDPQLNTMAMDAKVAAITRAREMLIHIRGDALDAIAKIEAIKRTKVEVRAHVDATRAHQQIQALTRARRIKLQADLDDARARMRLAALTGKNRHREAYIKANLDAVRARAGLRELEHGRTAEITPNLNNTRVAAVAARLAWLTHRREVVITTNIRNNGLYVAARAFNSLWRVGTSALKVLAGAMQGVLGIAAGLAAGVLKIGASATAAAAEGTGAFASMAARVTGSLAGMADSASAFASTMGQAFVSAMSNLPQLAITLITVTATFGAATFAAGVFIGVIAALAAAFLSLVSAAVGIVGLLGTMAVAMAAAGAAALALATVPLLPMVGALGLLLLNTDRVKEKFQELKSVLEAKVAPAADAMHDAFSKAFDGIVTWLDRLAPQLEKFFDAGSKFVQPLVDSLTGFIDEVLPRVTSALQDSGMVAFSEALRDTFIGLGRTFGDLAQLLAANGATFGAVIREMGRGIDVVVLALGRFTVNLSSGATSLGKAADGIAAFFDELGTRMGRALDTTEFDAFMTHVQEGIRLLGEGVGRWVEEAARHGAAFGIAFEAVAQALADSAEPMARFMAAGAQVLPTVLDGISAAMQTVMPALQNFMVVWANASPAIMQAIADVVAQILTNLSDASAVAGIQRMVDVFGQLVIALTTPEMIDALVRLGENFANLAAAVGPELIGALARFVDLLTPLSAGMAAASQFMTGDMPGAMESVGSAWDWLKGKFTSGNEEIATDTQTTFDVLQDNTAATLLAIREQALAATQSVAQAHGQMKAGVLTDWTTIGEYTNQINSGIGTAAENAQIRVNTAAAQAEVSWQTHMNTMGSSTATMFDTMKTGAAATSDNVALQAERMAQLATQGAQKGKDGIKSNMDGAKAASKSAYDGMSASSRETWDKIVTDAKTGTSNMNVTSTQAWNDLAKKIESTLTTAKTRIDSHSKEATKALGAVPKDAADKWPPYGAKVGAEANRALTAVRNAAAQMKAALNSVTAQTYTINVKVSTTKTVTEIKQAAATAKAAVIPRAAPLMAPRTALVPLARAGAFDVAEFREALPEESLYSSHRSGGALSDAISSAPGRQLDAGARTTQNHVTVNAKTDADPLAISREVAWQLKRITR